MAEQSHTPTWFSIIVFGLIWLGLGMVSSLFVPSDLPSPPAVVAAGALGAGFAGVAAVFYRVRRLPPVHTLLSIPIILLVGYPLFGLLISRAQRESEEAQQNRLNAVGREETHVVSRFFHSGPEAMDRYQSVAQDASLSQKLGECLEI